MIDIEIDDSRKHYYTTVKPGLKDDPVEVTMVDHSDFDVIFTSREKSILLTHEEFEAMMMLYHASHLR